MMSTLPPFLRVAIDNGSVENESGVVVLSTEAVHRLASEFDLTPAEFLQMIEDSRSGSDEPLPKIVVR